MSGWKAQARTAYAAGSITVRRQGEAADRVVSAGRHMAAALPGDWVLVVEMDGALWAVMLIGTAPTAYPENPAVDGGVGAGGTLIVPAGWSGSYQRETRKLIGDGWSIGQSRVVDYVWDGTHLTETVREDVLQDAAAFYPGLAGLPITAASITVRSTFTAHSSTTARIALLSAPATRPASWSGIVRLDSIASPALPTSGAVQVALPPGWVTQLASGAATGIGMYDDTRTSGYVLPSSIDVPSLSVTYA